MSYSPFETTLAFDPRRSPRLSAAVLSVYGVAGAACLATLPLPVAVLAAAAAVVGAWHDWRRLAPGPRLFWDSAGDWRRGDPQGPAWTLEPTTWSTPWLIVLVLRGPGGRLRIPLARDAVPAPAWRRLRARLQVDGPGLASA